MPDAVPGAMIGFCCHEKDSMASGLRDGSPPQTSTSHTSFGLVGFSWHEAISNPQERRTVHTIIVSPISVRFQLVDGNRRKGCPPAV